VALVLTFALAFAHAFATFAAFSSTFPILAFAFVAKAFALVCGTTTGIFVFAIFSAVCVRYVHAYAVLISAWIGCLEMLF
jgi:hypothetical protein